MRQHLGELRCSHTGGVHCRSDSISSCILIRITVALILKCCPAPCHDLVCKQAEYIATGHIAVMHGSCTTNPVLILHIPRSLSIPAVAPHLLNSVLQAGGDRLQRGLQGRQVDGLAQHRDGLRDLHVLQQLRRLDRALLELDLRHTDAMSAPNACRALKRCDSIGI